VAEKRRLPVLQNAPTPSPSEGGADGDTQPAWHWVPIGALVTIAVGVVLAKSFYVPYVQRQIERVYGAVRTPEEYARVNEHLATSVRDALQLRLMLAALPVAIVAMFVGGFVVGRFGAKTNARHGTLSGIASMVLLVLFAGRSVNASGAIAYALLVPIGALVSWFGARIGLWLRTRAE
jgi:flagellar biosynthesis protein FliQ